MGASPMRLRLWPLHHARGARATETVRGTIHPVIRIREILDPDLRAKIVAALAERRGMSAAAIPQWFELDDADYVDLLNDVKEAESGGGGGASSRDVDDPRM